MFHCFRSVFSARGSGRGSTGDFRWDGEDRILVEEFNSDNEKIDTALEQKMGWQLLKSTTQILTDGGNHIQLDLSGIDLSQYSALHIRADVEGRGYLFLAVQSDYLRDHAFPATSGPICLTLWTMREKNAYLSGVQFGSGAPFLSGFSTKVGDLKKISIFCKDYSSDTMTRGKLSLYGEA